MSTSRRVHLAHANPLDGLVDWPRLAAWLRDRGVGDGTITDVTPLSGGTQNVVARFRTGDDLLVLRRPPAHPRPESDETLRREARVLAALARTGVPHPPFVAAGPEDVLGCAFHVTRFVDGFAPTDGLPPGVDPDALAASTVEAAAALGAVDVEAVGLGGLGKPDGFLARQAPRWLAHLASYRSFDGYDPARLGDVEALASWLEAHRPQAGAPGLLHGDFHLGNVLASRRTGRIAAVLDWELCTVGDPLLDLGWLLATWPDPELPSTEGVWSVPDAALPPAADVVARYAASSPRDLSALPWYVVLACFKLAIVIEGTYARSCAGLAPDAVGRTLHDSAVRLLARAAAVAGSSWNPSR